MAAARKRWQDDKPFVAWLVRQEYAYWFKDVLKHHFTGDGVLLYMHEAWQAALSTRRKAS
jgi:hypothetical protein